MRWLAYRRDADRLPRPPAPRRDDAAAGRRTSPRRTSIATWRRPRRRGSASSGSPSTSTASPRRSTIWEHPFWEEKARDDLDAYCEFVRDHPAAARDRDGLRPRRARTGSPICSTRHDFDYVIGSVHFIGDRAVDDADFDVWERAAATPTRVWRRYFETLAEAARSGLFDILAHPDLVKVWGVAARRRERDPRFYYEPAVEAIAETGVAVEVSTAGCASRSASSTRRRAFAEMCVDAGRRSRSPPTPTCPRTSATPTIGRSRRCADWGVERDRRLRAARAPARIAGAAARWRRGTRRMSVRVGIGYDSHRFAAGRRLVLGGVEIEHERGLEGHSDADVLTHAVIDAMLGAAGLGDLGTHFPPDEEQLARRRLARPADGGLGMLARPGGERRRDGDLRGAADRRRTGRDGAATSLRPLVGAGERQGDDERGHGLDRPGRGDRLRRRGAGGPRMSAGSRLCRCEAGK